MARSRRKTPVLAHCGAASERKFKAQQHRRERVQVRQALAGGDDLPLPKAFGNPWAGPKDGKSYQIGLDPRWLRK